MWKMSSLLLIIFLLIACNKDDSVAMPKESSLQLSSPNQSKSVSDVSRASEPSEISKSAAPTPSIEAQKSIVISYKERGYKVEEKHVFTRNFEGMGDLTVIPVTKFANGKDAPLALIVTGGEKDIVLTPSREDGFAMFSSFEAISFKDIDDYSLKSGYTDIIVIADFMTGAGSDGAKPFSEVFIFKNDSSGNFIEDKLLEKRIRDSADSRTLTMKQVFELAKPFDIKSFIGSFTEMSSSEYAGSKVSIKNIDAEKMTFSVDAFHVNGGAKGVKNGNVNVGNIEDGIATMQGYIATYKATDSEFMMTFEFLNNGTFKVTEQGRKPFGMNVSASGVYKRDK